MSGIFGILDSKRKSPIAPLLTAMGTKMSHREWYVVDTHIDEPAGVGLGRIGIGLFNRERQPVVNQDRSLIAFMSGELYNVEEIRHRMEAKGHRLHDSSDLGLVLRLYEERGEQFIHDLEGIFILAILDRTRQRLLIANDRYGLRQMMYAHYDGRLLLAPEMKGILCDPLFRKKLKFTALAEYMRFQQLLGEKTFFEGIELLPNASLLEYNLQTDQLTIKPYWDFSRIAKLPPNTPFPEIVAETGRLFRQVVNRLTDGDYRTGVFLSGGLDSRTIIGLLNNEHRPVASITYGDKKCRDAVYASWIARRAGSKHHYFEFSNGEWVKQYADLHLTLTEGFQAWLHAHGISIMDQVRELIEVNLSGLAGDYILGGKRILLNPPVDELAFNCYLFHFYNQVHDWPGINEAEEKHLFSDELYPRLSGLAFESLIREVSRFSQYDFYDLFEYFNMLNCYRRLYQHTILFHQSHIEERYPYYDYNFFEFMYSLPPEVRRNRRLQIAVINHERPDLALIPWEYNGLLFTDRWSIWAGHALVQKLKNRINRHLAPIFSQLGTLYADYEHWLCTDLRDWAESILFDKRTLGRNIFNPQFIRSIWERHQAGREIWTIGKIAPIMTYEMMLRKFYD